ncbi:MAG: hypothetical protein EP346_10080 [Bacteroidetes bacterium]|nr:MAG: hypothetical protein EP346_10080 [Bacteroidota bacterium]
MNIPWFIHPFNFAKPFAIALLLALFGVHSSVNAQESSDLESGPTPYKLYLSPLPVIGSNPAYGFFFGAAASGSMYFGNPQTTSISNAFLSANYSTKNQLLLTLKSNAYTANNSWYLIGDWRILISSQPTYGLGTGPQNLEGSDFGVGYENAELNENKREEPMKFDLYRFYESFNKRIRPGLYMGLGVYLDRFQNIVDQHLSTDTSAPVLTNHYMHSDKHGFNPEKYTINGLSLNFIYDTRDNQSYPYCGQFAHSSFRYNSELLGSDQNSSTWWLEYRAFIGLTKRDPRHVLAFWTYGNFTTSGTLPYMALPSLGWDQMSRSGRGYAQGHYRGDDMVYLEAEYRFPLPAVWESKPHLFGATVFAHMTSASSDDNGIALFEYMKPGAGIGLRIMLDKEARTNLTLDYAWGADGFSGFYLNMNEYF